MSKKTTFLILLLLLSFFLAVLTVSSVSGSKLGSTLHEDRKNESITQEVCQNCHRNMSNTTSNITNDITMSVTSDIIKSQGIQNGQIGQNRQISYSGNYTTIMEVGQSERQLGFAFRKDTSKQNNGWQWQDTDGFGEDKLKNMIVLSILDNSTGTIRPVTGLATGPTWPRATFRANGGLYSYKADVGPSPITVGRNYPDMSTFLLTRNVDLTFQSGGNLTRATLYFYTYYSLEADWDYGYVSVLDGDDWINIQGTLTTNTNPNGPNQGNGITGSSGSVWVLEQMDLTPFIGKNITLGFRFKSDEATNAEGMYIDDIVVTTQRYCPPGLMCDQTTYTPLYDNAETAMEEKILSVNVTYPQMYISNYTDPLNALTAGFSYSPQVQQVNLQENVAHPGTYFGYFTYVSFAQYYQGDYNVDLNTNIGGTPVTGSTQFKTTMYGCQNCHNSYNNAETSFLHTNHAMGECAKVCHTGSRGLFGVIYMGPPLSANPMHLHDMIYGHYGGWGDTGGQTSYNVSAHINVSCKSCHTPFIHDDTGPDTAQVASLTLRGTNMTYLSGTHSGMTCESCHGDLSYPNIPQGQYTLSGVLQNYTPSFTSSISFTDTFVVDVNGLENLTVSVTGDNKYVWMNLIGPIDNTSTGLQGPCEHGYPCHSFSSMPTSVNIVNPYRGRWLVNLIMMQEGKANYTITSSYPIERKHVVKIPECNECHKPSSTGKTNSAFEIPKWNPGFAHADANGDGVLDVQCRMCHDSMHNITVKTCQTCHSKAPVGHFVQDPEFGSYTAAQCLTCHGDPHKVTGGGRCIDCHSNDVNISKFGRHANMSTNDGYGVVSDEDCQTCHYNKDMNKANIYLCDSCHTNSSGIVPVTGPTLLIGEFSHGPTQCKSCHAPVKYHINGTVGPLGLMELFIR